MAHRVGLQRSIRAFRACGIRRPHPSTKRAESDSRGFGRNCTVFDKLRLWAYVAVRQYRGSSIVAWREAVYAQAQSCNEFESPLLSTKLEPSERAWPRVWARDADAEARFIAKQVKEGRNGGKANSSEVQAIKGAKGGKAKGAANFNKRVPQRLWEWMGTRSYR